MEKNKLKEIIEEQLQQGKSLSEIQKILATEYSQKMTFLDLRILASELAIATTPKEEKLPEAKINEEEENFVAAPPPEKTSGTVVEMSKLLRPGAVAGGSVKFSSGASAEWQIDQLGRLGLNNVKGTPTEKDIQEFQVELQKLLSRGR